jgi:hypothetical protein
MQPGLREPPFFFHSGQRESDGVGCFLNRQPAEAPKLDDLTLPRIERGQA